MYMRLGAIVIEPTRVAADPALAEKSRNAGRTTSAAYSVSSLPHPSTASLPLSLSLSLSLSLFLLQVYMMCPRTSAPSFLRVFRRWILVA